MIGANHRQLERDPGEGLTCVDVAKSSKLIEGTNGGSIVHHGPPTPDRKINERVSLLN
jgi:hypothetical protein